MPRLPGADIGWLKQMEDEGVRWLDDGEKQKDALQILKDHGINAVRLRVFVNPPKRLLLAERRHNMDHARL